MKKFIFKSFLFSALTATVAIGGIYTYDAISTKQKLEDATVETQSTDDVSTYTIPSWVDFVTVTESSSNNYDDGTTTDTDYSVDVSFQINSSYSGSLDQIYIIPNAADPSVAIKLTGVQIGQVYSTTIQYDRWGVGTYGLQLGFGDYTNPANVYTVDYVNIGHMDYVMNPVTNITTSTATLSYTVNSWGETNNTIQYRVYEVGTTPTTWSSVTEVTSLGTNYIGIPGLASNTSYIAEIMIDGDVSTKQYQIFSTSIDYSEIYATNNAILSTSTTGNIGFDYTQNDGNGVVQYRVYQSSTGPLPDSEVNESASWLNYPGTVTDDGDGGQNATDYNLTIDQYYKLNTSTGKYELTRLSPSTSYTVELRADGWINTTETVTFITGAESTVDILSVDDVTPYSATINYQFARYRGAGLVEYRVYKQGTPITQRPTWTVESTPTNGGNNYVYLDNLDPSTTYVFEIRVDGKGVDTITFTTEGVALISNVQIYSGLNNATVVYTLDHTNVNHTPVIEYRYKTSGSGGWTNWTADDVVIDTSATTEIEQFEIVNLNPDTTYDIEIRVDGDIAFTSSFSTNAYSYSKPLAVDNITEYSARITIDYKKYGGDGKAEFRFRTTAVDSDESNPYVSFGTSATTNGSYYGYTYSTSLAQGTNVWGDDGYYYIEFSGLMPDESYTLDIRTQQSGQVYSISFVTSNGQKSQASNIQVNNVQDDTAIATFTFTQGSAGSTEYYWAVEKASTSTVNYQWTLVTGVTNGTQTINLTGLEANTDYVFAVKVDGIASSVMFKTNQSGKITNVTVDETTKTDDYVKISYEYTRSYGDSNNVYYRLYQTGSDSANASWVKINNINEGVNYLEFTGLAAGTNYTLEFKVDGVITSKTVFETDFLTTVTLTDYEINPSNITLYYDYEKNSGDGVVEYRWYSTPPTSSEEGWVEMTQQEKIDGVLVIGDDEEDLDPGTSYVVEVRTDQYINDAASDETTTNGVSQYALGDFPFLYFDTPMTTYASAQTTTDVTSTTATLNYSYYYYSTTGINTEYRLTNLETGSTEIDWTLDEQGGTTEGTYSIGLTNLTPDTFYQVEYRVWNPNLDTIPGVGGNEGGYVYSSTTFATKDVAHVTNIYSSSMSFDSATINFTYRKNDGAGLVEYKIVETQSQATVTDWTTYQDPKTGSNSLYVGGLDEETEYTITFVTDRGSTWSETTSLTFSTTEDGFYILLVWIVVFMAMTIITSGAGLTYFIGKNEKRYQKDKKELEAHITAKSLQQDAEIKKHLVEEQTNLSKEAEDKRLSV